jgi:hypothetical protein
VSEIIGLYELMISDVEGTAEWRHGLADKYPNDAERNLRAAKILERLAQQLPNLEGGALHYRAAALVDRLDAADVVRIVNDVTHSVGFGNEPDTAEEFINVIITDMQRELEGEARLSLNTAKTRRSIPDSNAPLMVARITEVVEHLKLLRLNSLHEDIAKLEEISNELSQNADEINLREIGQKALKVLGFLLDQLGSTPGARMIVSGAATGILSLIGVSPTIAFGISSAAWLGKADYMKILSRLFKAD